MSRHGDGSGVDGSDRTIGGPMKVVEGISGCLWW